MSVFFMVFQNPSPPFRTYFMDARPLSFFLIFYGVTIFRGNFGLGLNKTYDLLSFCGNRMLRKTLVFNLWHEMLSAN